MPSRRRKIILALNSHAKSKRRKTPEPNPERRKESVFLVDELV
jgi:hypothetical protein